MIDTDKYEGHSKGPWKHMYQAWGGVDYIMSPYEGCVAKIDNGDKSSVENRADALLVADAPLLLAEVKRLRGLLMKGSEDYTTSYMDLRNIIEDVHWELTGDDHESNEERIKYALIALSEVIG